MAMNPIHGVVCSSRWWRRTTATKVIPWVVGGVDLGDRALEIGPGYGANLHALRRRTAHLSGLEIDPKLARRLRSRYAGVATIVEGDAASMPFADGEFSAVVSCSMLHHVPSAELQDAIFAEAFRVLRPGGLFAGSDGAASPGFRLIHVGDTYVTVDPTTLASRLGAAGFSDIEVRTAKRHFRFRARRPGAEALSA